VTNAGDEFLTLSPQMSPTCHPYHSVLLMATDDNQHSIHNLAYHKLRFTMPSTIVHPVCRSMPNVFGALAGWLPRQLNGNKTPL